MKLPMIYCFLGVPRVAEYRRLADAECLVPVEGHKGRASSHELQCREPIREFE